MTKRNTDDIDLREGDALIIIRREGERVMVYGSIEQGFGPKWFESRLDEGIKKAAELAEQYSNYVEEMTRTRENGPTPAPFDNEEWRAKQAEVMSKRNCTNCGRSMMSKAACVLVPDNPRVTDRYLWWWSHEDDHETTNAPCPGFVKPSWQNAEADATFEES